MILLHGFDPRGPRPDVDALLDAVHDVLGVRRDLATTRTRAHPATLARTISAALLRETCHQSLHEIKSTLRLRSHTTVISLLRRAQRYWDSDEPLILCQEETGFRQLHQAAFNRARRLEVVRKRYAARKAVA